MTNEQVRNQLMELRLKDLTPDAFDLLFNFAFFKVFENGSLAGVGSQAATKIIQKKPATSRKPKPKKAETVSEPKGETKSAKALWVLRQYTDGLKAAEIAELTNDKTNLVYPMLSNLKSQGKVVYKDGRYYAPEEAA